MLKRNKIALLSIFVFVINIQTTIFSQVTGDFRSRQSGIWTGTTTWQKYNGTTWQNTTLYPTSTDGVITICNGHNVAIDANIIVDQMVIDAGGTLSFYYTPALIIFEVADGLGTDLINNGTISVTDYHTTDSRLNVYGTLENNNYIEIEIDCHLNVYGTLINNDSIITEDSAVYSGKLNVYEGGILKCSPSSIVGGIGDFVLNRGGTIEIGSPQGISLLGTNTGNIRTTKVRTFSEEAYYIYNGIANQVTGTALSKAAGVIISNSSGKVTLTDTIDVNFLQINSGSKLNLSTFTNKAGALVLPEGSYSIGTWGSSVSTATNKNNIYFDSTASGIVQLTNIVISIYSSLSTFTTCSTDSAFDVIVEAWGGGGKAGTRVNNGAGGGGGGGAYSRDTITIVPGNTYTIAVGMGSSVATNPGGDSWFGTSSNVSSALVLAKGGNSVANDVATGATGGSASAGIGAVKYSGGTGATGMNGPTYYYGGGGGSSAGVSANGNSPVASSTPYPPPPASLGAVAPDGGGDGGHAKFANSGPGNPGNSPGSGGGGSLRTSTTAGTVNGGAGANGRVKLSYSPTFPTVQMSNTNFSVCQGVTSRVIYLSNFTGCPDLYMIDFNTAANNAGFKDFSYTTLPNDSIPIIIPDTAPGGTYQGVISIKSGVKGFPTSFPVTVNIVDVTFTTVSNSVSCYGLSDGSIAITINGTNNSPYSFSIDNGLNYNTIVSGSFPNYLISNLPANTYKIRIKDKSGCISVSCP